MNKTKIEWPDYVWNPIKGFCPVGCWYCYARRIYQRFGLDQKLRRGKYNENRLAFDPESHLNIPKKPSKIFVCSTMEIFHPNISSGWRDAIFYIIRNHPQHTFIILTKMPERIDRPMPENVWLGVSVTKREELSRLDYLYDAPAGNHRFVSFEPLLDDVLDGPNGILIGLKWIIVGRLTGYGNKYNPSKVAIRRIINAAKMFEIPLFMKDNLKSIWPGKLIQEWPKW